MITPEDHWIIDRLLENMVKSAEAHDGLISPDSGTLEIIRKCIGVGLLVGRFLERMPEDLPMEIKYALALEAAAEYSRRPNLGEQSRN